MNIWRDLNREAHLWYTLTSPEWVLHAKPLLQSSLDILRAGLTKQPLAAGYPPVPYWGGVMESILTNFDNAVTIMRAGNFDPIMSQCARLMDVPRGFSESVQWLEGQDNARMLDLLDEAYSVCSRLLRALTMSQRYQDVGYRDGSADWRYENPKDAGIISNTIMVSAEETIYKVIGRPLQIPEYVADTAVTCNTGDIVPWTGVWVPTPGMGTAALAFVRQGIQVMQPAYELAREYSNGERREATKLVDTTWYPVKPTGRMVPLPPAGSSTPTGADGASLGFGTGSCDANQPCPRTGWWVTPAQAGSRRHFSQGEVMPAFKSDYGLTIWQWDDNQSPH